MAVLEVPRVRLLSTEQVSFREAVRLANEAGLPLPSLRETAAIYDAQHAEGSVKHCGVGHRGDEREIGVSTGMDPHYPMENPLSDPKIGESLKRRNEPVFPMWTGTVIGYPEPGEPLGSTIVYDEHTIHVPKSYSDKTDCAVMIDHPDFVISPEGVFWSEFLKLVPHFPQKWDWYGIDPETGLAIVERQMESQSEEDAPRKFLWRMKAPFLGPVVPGKVSWQRSTGDNINITMSEDRFFAFGIEK